MKPWGLGSLFPAPSFLPHILLILPHTLSCSCLRLCFRKVAQVSLSAVELPDHLFVPALPASCLVFFFATKKKTRRPCDCFVIPLRYYPMLLLLNVAPGCGFNHPTWLNQLENTYSLLTIFQASYIITTPSTPSPHHKHLTPTPVCLPFLPPNPLPLHAHSKLDVLMPALLPPPKLWSLKRFLRDLGITGPSRGAFTLLGPDSIYQISL